MRFNLNNKIKKIRKVLIKMNIGTKWDYVGMTQLEIENKFDSYYVYHHIYIPTNEVIYVGKGMARRCVSFNRRPYYEDYKKGLIEVDIVYRTDDEKEALEYEEMEVFYFKYIGMAKYNSDEFHEGKRRGNGMKEMAIGTEVQELEICDTQEVIYENEYEYSRNFDDYLNSIEIKNIYPPQFMLNMISDKEIRDNTERFLNNLEDIEVEELYDLYTLYKQLLHERMNEIEDIYSTRIIYRYLKKYFN